ncbi:hypothetical protein BN1080_00303 [Planococcus massiliensis]|uniref:Uncharacterized protein n=1 Tax=Planococcus massiliensis TaxID=1499687 RepID=A0A098EGI6_9BACL|nr:hypothetical protein [Planococcus massiliensis]CEG21393.1 hypothetical protein BN1080_00303 [Planococcus massiliensis]
MKKESIRSLLETICEYNNVRIIQTFTKENVDQILVKCVPNTQVLELTYLHTGTVEQYQSVTEAAEVIHQALYSHATA